MTALTPSTIRAPSSTRTPVGSVTEISLPVSINGNSVVIVIALGALSREAPGIGDVETKVFAVAGETARKRSPTTSASALARFISSSFSSSRMLRSTVDSRLSSHFFRLRAR